MISGKDEHVVLLKFQGREPAIDGFKSAGVTFDVVAMAKLLIEIDEVYKDQPFGLSLHRGDGLLHAVVIVFRLDRMRDAAAEEDVSDFPNGIHGNVFRGEAIEQHALRRRNGVIVPVRSTGKRAGLSYERTGDDAAYFVGSVENVASDFTNTVEFRERNDLFMRGDLKDAIGGGVD